MHRPRLDVSPDCIKLLADQRVGAGSEKHRLGRNVVAGDHAEVVLALGRIRHQGYFYTKIPHDDIGGDIFITHDRNGAGRIGEGGQAGHPPGRGHRIVQERPPPHRRL